MPKKPVLLLTYVTAEDPGQVSVILEGMGHACQVLRLNKGDALPARIEGYAGVVSFGGPESANDDHVAIVRAELDWLPRVMAQGVPLLGICLGSQLIARALGAHVGPHPTGHYEFGYYPITPLAGADKALALPAELQVYHRHGEGFELPAGATHLAHRDSFPRQAFRHGRTTWGIQFHPEVNDAVLERWLGADPPDLARSGAQPAAAQRAAHTRHQAAMHAWLARFLALWLASPG